MKILKFNRIFSRSIGEEFESSPHKSFDVFTEFQNQQNTHYQRDQ